MIGAPRLHAAFGNGKAFGQGIDTLKTELALDFVLILGKYLCAELLFEILTDYPHHLAESCLDGIVDGIVHDCLTVGS